MRMLPLVLLAGCLGAKSDNPDDTDVVDTDTTVPCDATIASFDPVNGATEVPRDQLVTVTFTAPVVDGNPWSLALVGIEGSAALAPDGLSATFTPDAPLPSDTNVQVQAEVCDDAGLAAFTTRFAVDADTLAGRTYAVNYGAVNFITPPLANALTPADWILVQIDQVDPVAETLTTFAGLGNGTTPTPDCPNSFDSGVASFAENPVLTVGPTDFVIPFGADSVTIEDFVMDGRFGPGAGVLAEVHISGNLDTRGITTIGGVCALSALSGAPCGPCRDGVMQCLPVEAEAAQADYWAELDIQATCGL
ncbi:MAG: Ig-like domain-containing protein [Myxococcota bacterium]